MAGRPAAPPAGQPGPPAGAAGRGGFGGPATPPIVGYPRGYSLQASLDGNTVELSTEQTLFAENAVQYRTTLSFLQGRVSTIMTALRGE